MTDYTKPYIDSIRLAEAEVAIYAEKCADYARELGRLRERVSTLTVERDNHLEYRQKAMPEIVQMKLRIKELEARP